MIKEEQKIIENALMCNGRIIKITDDEVVIEFPDEYYESEFRLLNGEFKEKDVTPWIETLAKPYSFLDEMRNMMEGGNYALKI